MDRRAFILQVPAVTLLRASNLDRLSLKQSRRTWVVLAGRAATALARGPVGFIVGQGTRMLLRRGFRILVDEAIEGLARLYARHESAYSVTYATPGFSLDGGTPEGERCRVTVHGCEFSYARREYYTIGPLLWAALGDHLNEGETLRRSRCGYPIAEPVNTGGPPGEEVFVEQRFERGLARLLYDEATRTAEGLYSRNMGRQVWFPDRA